ncbi:MAG: internal scaffolding protein [Microviridae sp.]|nr:MAG: internal scaffolding protein [Microviridae sp.]
MSSSSHSLPFIRSPFNYSTDSASLQSGLSCDDPSLTQQQFAAETDINNIVSTFLKTGYLPEPSRMPQYVDYEGIFDYQTALNVVRLADENFMKMDARVRARFHNSPQEFLDFFADPANHAEAQALGLTVPSTDKQSGASAPKVEEPIGDGSAS